MYEELTLSVIIGAVIGAAAIISPLVYKGIRYVINKDTCLTIFKNKLEHQEQETIDGHETHKNLYQELEDVKIKQASSDAKLDLLLDHFNIIKD